MTRSTAARGDVGAFNRILIFMLMNKQGSPCASGTHTYTSECAGADAQVQSVRALLITMSSALSDIQYTVLLYDSPTPVPSRLRFEYRKDKHIFRDKLVVRLAVQKVYPFFITVICIGMCNTNPQKVDQVSYR